MLMGYHYAEFISCCKPILRFVRLEFSRSLTGFASPSFSVLALTVFLEFTCCNYTPTSKYIVNHIKGTVYF